MGLANRLVPKGTALAAAVKLAKEIAAFPQACMRADRMSSYTQWNLDLPAALLSETRTGFEVVQSGDMKASEGPRPARAATVSSARAKASRRASMTALFRGCASGPERFIVYANATASGSAKPTEPPAPK